MTALLAEIRTKLAEHETTGYLPARGRLTEFVQQRGVMRSGGGISGSFVNRAEVEEYADWLGLPIVTPLKSSPNFALAKLAQDGLELRPWTAIVATDSGGLSVSQWFGIFSTNEDATLYKLRFD